ncbi:hypothetical protein COU79_01915 [Candidatus Peregrinibacteria bacterium CG10_big_fil_rev_8_21_14_0_10_54_7]|nr:MAG: hypothetical protein COU79_01915 [Candidatus Peregrinibacteria bacterium CG10_big_fil_rev_8_21_14_0_10_54_7]
MDTHNPFTELGHCHNEADVSPRERRLVFVNGQPGEDQEQQPEAGANAGQPGAAEHVNRQAEQTGGQVRQLVPEAGQEQNVREATERNRPFSRTRDRRTNAGTEGRSERGTETRNTPREEAQNTQRNDPTRQPPAPAAVPAAAPSQGETASAHGLELSKKPQSAAVNAIVTSGVVGGSVAAGMNAAKLANVPVLGKFASIIGSGLNAASNGISSLLTQAGAPSQLSFLANPWVIGLATPVLGLWMLGKYRIHTLKNFYLSNPHSPNAKDTLERIQQMENTQNILARTWYPIREGMKLVTGAVRLPFRIIPEPLGFLTGRAAGFVAGIGKKLGGLKDIASWPFRNFKHLAVGGIGGGAAAGIGTSALGYALAGGAGASVLGPWAVPIATAIGAIYGYHLSKRKKSGGGAKLATDGE